MKAEILPLILNLAYRHRLGVRRLNPDQRKPSELRLLSETRTPHPKMRSSRWKHSGLLHTRHISCIHVGKSLHRRCIPWQVFIYLLLWWCLGMYNGPMWWSTPAHMTSCHLHHCLLWERVLSFDHVLHEKRLYFNHPEFSNILVISISKLMSGPCNCTHMWSLITRLSGVVFFFLSLLKKIPLFNFSCFSLST